MVDGPELTGMEEALRLQISMCHRLKKYWIRRETLWYGCR